MKFTPLFVAGEEFNIFGEVRPVEELITSVHTRTLQPIDSSVVQNFFAQYMNGEIRLFPCKHHQKLEAERKEELNRKGFVFKLIVNKLTIHRIQLSCALAKSRCLFHTCHTVMQRELSKKR